MTHDDLEWFRVEGFRLVNMWVEASRSLEAAKISGIPAAIARAKEAVLDAAVSVGEMMLRDPLVDRMATAIEPLDDLGNDPATWDRRSLLMHLQFLRDTRSLGIPDLADVFISETQRQLDELWPGGGRRGGRRSARSQRLSL